MKSKKVLIVDDDAQFLEEMKEALSAKGYSISTALTGKEAARIFKKILPDVVLMDKRLSDCDGQELIKNFKRIHVDAIFILITAYGTLESSIDALESDVSDYITKPVSVEQVYAKIEKNMGKMEAKKAELTAVTKKYQLKDIEYRTLFESANDAIFIADTKTGVIIDCNNAASRLLGYKKNEIIGMHQSFLHPKEDAQKYKNLFKKHSEEYSMVSEAEVLARNGERIPVSISAAAVEIGSIKYLQGIFRDLREIKKAKEKINEIEKRNIKLKEYDELKSKFVSNVAHEIKNPLNIIKIGISSLADILSGSKNHRIMEILNIEKREIERLVRFTNNMLDLSKIESGKMPVRIEQIKLKDAINEAAEFYKDIIKNKKIEFVLDTKNAPEDIPADKDLLGHVINNLLDNAVKYTPEGGAIGIKAYKLENMARIEIKNSGPSIPKDQIDKMFNKYFRIFKQKEAGTGLGLSIVSEMVKLHKGKIWVESEEGKEAVFFVELPVV